MSEIKLLIYAIIHFEKNAPVLQQNSYFVLEINLFLYIKVNLVTLWISILFSDTRKWLCVSTPPHNSGPGPRHGHSAVVYQTGMYLFGGLMGLSEQKDFWKWDFINSSWYNIRTRWSILFVKLNWHRKRELALLCELYASRGGDTDFSAKVGVVQFKTVLLPSLRLQLALLGRGVGNMLMQLSVIQFWCSSAAV